MAGVGEVVSVEAAPAAPAVPARAGTRSGRLAVTLPVVCLLVLLAWLVHWRTFSGPELGQDGFLSVDLADSPLADMLAFTARDVHPPLFYSLLHWEFALAGTFSLGAKLVPVAAATLALVVFYRIGARLAGSQVGFLATVLLALSSPYLFLAPTVRPFTLALLCSLFTLLVTLRVLRGLGRGKVAALDLVLLVGSTALALLGWYLQVFFLALEVVLVALTPTSLPGGERPHVARADAGMPHGRPWAQESVEHAGRSSPGRPLGPSPLGRGVGVRVPALLALGVGALLAAPWYAYVLPGLLGKLRQGATVTEGTPTIPALPVIVVGLIKAVVGRDDGWLPAVALVGWLVALAVGIWCCWRGAGSRERAAAWTPGDGRGRALVLLLGLVLGSAAVIAILLRWQHPNAAGRYLLGVLPFVVLLQALALRTAPALARAVAGVGVAAAVAGQLAWFGALVTSPPIDWEHDPVLAYLATQTRPGDELLFSDRARRAQYRLNTLYNQGLPAALIQTGGDSFMWSTPEQARQTVAALVQRGGRLWYLESSEWPGTPHLGEEALVAQAFYVSQREVSDANVQLFLTRQPDQERSLHFTLGQLVMLESAAYTSTAAPGGQVTVDLVWRDERPLGGPYSVFVHLDSASGHLVAQHDGVPAAGTRPTEHWQAGEVIDDRHGLLLPADVPPGDYMLHVGMYQVNGQRLALPDGTNQITLGVVHVGG